MNKSVSADESQHKNRGRIEGLTVPLILGSIHRAGTTGVLHFTKGNIKKSIYIKDGDIIFALSSDMNDRLGELLIKKGKVTYKDLEEAVSKLGSGKKLGALLTESSKMSPEDLVENVVDQVKNIVFSIFEWEEGYYQYEEGNLPSLELITLSQGTPDILFQGIRKMSNLKVLLRSLGGLKRKFIIDLNNQDKMKACLISDNERRIAELLKVSSSAEEILKSTSQNTLDVIKTLVAMKITGLAKEAMNPVLRSFLKESHIKGDLSEEDIIIILSLLKGNDVEGSLYIKSGPIEVGFFIKNSDLVSLYLPEEKISLVDFLSKKTIDQEEQPSGENLEDRIQKADVSSEKRWEEEDESFGLKVLDEVLQVREGEFIFLEGEKLPDSGILINKPITTVILKAVEKIDDMSRIEKGCGGLDTWLIITPSYLSIIDNLPVNNQLWDIISKLQAPCTVREILSSFQKMGEFELYRWLWLMQAVGAIKRFDDEEEAQDSELAYPKELDESQEVDTEENDESQEEEKDGKTINAEKTISKEPSVGKSSIVETSVEEHSEKAKLHEGVLSQEDRLKEIPTEKSHSGSESLDEEWKDLLKEKEEAELAQKEATVSSPKDVEKKEQTIAESAHRQSDSMTASNEEENEKEISIDEKIIEDVKNLNEKQKYLFEKLKAELGAGTQNFIHYCISRMGKEENNPFVDINLTPSGDWDTPFLTKRIVRNNIEQYQLEFDKLLNIELEMVGNFISAEKKEEMRKGVMEIEKRQMKIE